MVNKATVLNVIKIDINVAASQLARTQYLSLPIDLTYDNQARLRYSRLPVTHRMQSTAVNSRRLVIE